MGYALKPGTYFCDVSDRLVFLDVNADRYFCLSRARETAFRELAVEQRNPISFSAEHENLIRSGLVIPMAGAAFPIPCQASIFPKVSALDWTVAPERWSYAVGSLAALLKARAAFRFHHFGDVLDALAKQKAQVPPATPDKKKVAAIAHALDFTARFFRSHDQCLPRSLAATRQLLALGYRSDLVIGVRMRPFSAHCWTQTADSIVNDRFDHVRSFTPILVV